MACWMEFQFNYSMKKIIYFKFTRQSILIHVLPYYDDCTLIKGLMMPIMINWRIQGKFLNSSLLMVPGWT